MSEPITLSQRGHTRKQEILAGMWRAAARRKRRRHTLAALATAAPVLAVAAVGASMSLTASPGPSAPAAAWLLTPAPAPAPAPAHPGAPVPSAPVLAMRHARFEIASSAAPGRIQTLSDALTLPVEILDDEALSAELRLAGKDPGVVRTDAGVRVAAAERLSPVAPR
jgi:hypothetical protein